MARNASDLLLESLIDWGVDTVFGLPGDGINGIMEALRVRQDKVRFIQVRHEEAAAFMACAYAKFTGRLGVCLATSGPGGVHLLTGLYDAKLDGQPVLAITGNHHHDLLGTHQQQDVDLARLFQDVAVYSQVAMGPRHLANIADVACRTALAYRGVAHINVPTDMQSWAVDSSHTSAMAKAYHTSSSRASRAGLPAPEDLARACEILNAGKKVAILAGRGALGATDQLERLADTLAAPIIKPLLGKACVPDDSPYTTGGIGLLGTGPSQDAMENCDTLLMVGTSFPYIEFYPRPGSVKSVQIDLDPARVGLRYPVDVGLIGDSASTLDLLMPMLERKADRGFLERARKGMSDWWQTIAEREQTTDTPMDPQVVAGALDKQLSDTAIVTSDSGTITTWWARHIRARRGQMFSCSGTLATMACGLPYAIGAQVAYPDRQVVAFVGDGGFTMLMGEFATAVKYKLPIKVFVIKNNTLGQIKWEQMVFLGNPEFGCDLHPIDFAGFARACGGAAFVIDDPATCREQVARALATHGPVLVEAVVNPFVPPMPARVSASQAMHFAESLVRGEPNRSKIALTVLSDRVREMV